MAIKFQYNKTAIQKLQRQLTIREKALPTLKSKETALRLEVQKSNELILNLKKDFDEVLNQQGKIGKLWAEVPEVLDIEQIDVSWRNIAGVKIPEIEKIDFKAIDFSIFSQQAWIPEGLNRIMKVAELDIAIKTAQKQHEILNYARKKTTQKVNLYEKVQIPEFSDAVMKIKRFLEDAENLEKSSQKIVKQRNQEREAAL